MKYKDFTKMYDLEVEKLMECAGSAWAVYHIIKRCAFIDLKHREKRYWSFPSQMYISKALGWSDLDAIELNGSQRKKVRRATDALVEVGLLKIYRSLQDIDKDKKKAIKNKDSKSTKALHKEYKKSSWARDQLVEWGKLTKHRSARVLIYELIALRDIELAQIQDKNAPVNETDMDDTETDLDSFETEMPPEEEKHSLEKKKKKVLYLNKEEIVYSKSGLKYTETELKELLKKEGKKAVQLFETRFGEEACLTINGWIGTWRKQKIEHVELVQSALAKALGL